MFLYVFALLITITSSSTWKIKIHNNTSLTIQPGVFYPINISLELTGDDNDDDEPIQPYKALTNLSLSSSSSSTFQTSEPYYELNSFLTLNYTIYIGVPCSFTPSPSPFAYNVDFTLSNNISFAFANTLSITIINRDTPISISVELLNTKISEGTFSMYYIYSPNLTNVDPITFTFTNTTQSYSSVENKTMQRYSQVKPRNFRGFYNATRQTDIPQQYTISIDNKCYILSKPYIEFTIGAYKQKDISSYKTSIIKQFANFKRNDNSISFDLIIPISPTIVNCVAVTKTSVFPSGDEIRRGYLTTQSSPYIKYFNYFIRNVQQNVTVSFTNLSTFRSYRIQCLVDDAVVNETERTSANITIGEFYNADIHVNTNPHPAMPFTTQCLTFQFGSDEGLTQFMPKMIDFCDNYFYTLSGMPSSMNGCVKCVERVLPEEHVHERSVCVVSEEYCASTYSGYIHYNVLSLKEMLRSTADVQYLLNLTALALLKDVIKEEDNFDKSAKYEDYIFGYPEIPDNIGVSSSVDVVFKNNNTLSDFNCYVLDFDVNIPHRNLTREDFIGHSTEIFLPRKTVSITNVNLTINFKDDVYDNNIYPIIVKCFPLAFIDHRINESPALLLNSFIRTNKTIPEDTQVPKKNCNDKNNTLESECLNLKYYQLREFTVFNGDGLTMKPDTTALKENFMRLQYKFQKIKVIVEEETLLLTYQNVSRSNIEMYLKQHVVITDLLKCCNCNKFPGYETCKMWKNKTMKNLTDSLMNVVDTRNTSMFVESVLMYVNGLNETEYYNRVILLYMAVFGLTTNPEAIHDVVAVYKLYELLYNAYEELTKVNSDTNMKYKENILYIMLSMSFNLVEISRFEMLDIGNNSVSSSISSDSSVNDTDIEVPKFQSNKTLIEMYDNINHISRMIIQQVSTTSSLRIIYNNNLIHLFKSTHNQNEKISKRINDKLYVEIELNPYTLIHSVDPTMNNDIRYIGVTVYNIYPFISEEDKSTITYFISVTPFTNASTTSIPAIPKSSRPTVMFSNTYDDTTPIKEKYTKCIYIDNEHVGVVDIDNIESEMLNSDESQIKCYLSRSGDVTIQRGYEIATYRGWIVILIIFVTVVAFVIALFVFAKKKAEQALKRKRVNLLDSGYKTIDSNENSAIEEGNYVNESVNVTTEEKDKIKDNINKNIKGYNIDDL